MEISTVNNKCPMRLSFICQRFFKVQTYCFSNTMVRNPHLSRFSTYLILFKQPWVEALHFCNCSCAPGDQSSSISKCRIHRQCDTLIIWFPFGPFCLQPLCVHLYGGIILAIWATWQVVYHPPLWWPVFPLRCNRILSSSWIFSLPYKNSLNIFVVSLP